MNKVNIYLIVCIITIIIAGFIVEIWNVMKNNKIENYTNNIKEITSQTKIIDANTDHNQALDVAEYAVAQGVKIPKILINFDTHSDIMLNSKVNGKAGLENWINEYFAKNNNAEILYWVMPKEEALEYELRTFFGENKEKYLQGGVILFGNSLKPDNRGRFAVIPITLKAYSSDFLIDINSGILNEYYLDNPIVKELFYTDVIYKKIKIITCTEETLPDFKDQDVFLSIDADYISNSGFDTTGDFKILKTPEQIEQSFNNIFKTLNKKHIKPKVISLSLSPQYLPKEHHKQVSDIFIKIIKISGLKDALATYKRTHPKELDQIRETYKNPY